jgi:hypothetical protein
MTVGVLVVVVVLNASCKEKACPVCPPPGPGTGTQPVLDAAGVEEYAGYEFRLVEQGGNVAFVGTSSKGRVVVIPLDPRTRMFADGKEGKAGDVLAFSPSTGGCPCTLQRCLPWCRVAAPVLDLPPESFWGPDVPKWTLPAVPPPAPTP